MRNCRAKCASFSPPARRQSPFRPAQPTAKHSPSSPRPSKRASGSAVVVSCSPNTMSNCRRSCRKPCATSASCRSASCCRTLRPLVHHGGIGTCAQGLAAGVPHLVQPMSYDQFDNSRRLVRLGVAEEISVRRFRGPAVAAALAPLLDSPTVATRCRELAARCDGPAALAAACEALEQLADSKSHAVGVRTKSTAAYTLM